MRGRLLPVWLLRAPQNLSSKRRLHGEAVLQMDKAWSKERTGDLPGALAELKGLVEFESQLLESQQSEPGGRDPTGLIQASNRLGLIMLKQHDLDAAGLVLQSALDHAQLRAQQGLSHDAFVDTGGLMNDLAVVALFQGRLEDADRLLRRCRYRSERAYKPDPHLLSTTYANLGAVHRELATDLLDETGGAGAEGGVSEREAALAQTLSFAEAALRHLPSIPAAPGHREGGSQQQEKAGQEHKVVPHAPDTEAEAPDDRGARGADGDPGLEALQGRWTWVQQGPGPGTLDDYDKSRFVVVYLIAARAAAIAEEGLIHAFRALDISEDIACTVSRGRALGTIAELHLASLRSRRRPATTTHLGGLSSLGRQVQGAPVEWVIEASLAALEHAFDPQHPEVLAMKANQALMQPPHLALHTLGSLSEQLLVPGVEAKQEKQEVLSLSHRRFHANLRHNLDTLRSFTDTTDGRTEEERREHEQDPAMITPMGATLRPWGLSMGVVGVALRDR